MELVIGIFTIASLLGILIYIIISDRRFQRELRDNRPKLLKDQPEKRREPNAMS